MFTTLQEMIDEDCPARVIDHRLSYVLRQGWLKNHKYHALDEYFIKYMRIDREKKAALMRARGED